jgi:hypothetical protein
MSNTRLGQVQARPGEGGRDRRGRRRQRPCRSDGTGTCRRPPSNHRPACPPPPQPPTAQGAKFFRADDLRDEHGRLLPAPGIVLLPGAPIAQSERPRGALLLFQNACLPALPPRPAA